jgi:hypothetical protein
MNGRWERIRNYELGIRNEEEVKGIESGELRVEN